MSKFCRLMEGATKVADRNRPATPRQCRELQRRGYDPTGLTISEASEVISGNAPTIEQLELARQLGIAYLPTNARTHIAWLIRRKLLELGGQLVRQYPELLRPGTELAYRGTAYRITAVDIQTLKVTMEAMTGRKQSLVVDVYWLHEASL